MMSAQRSGSSRQGCASYEVQVLCRQWPDADGKPSRGVGRERPPSGSDVKTTAAIRCMPSREERPGWCAPLRAGTSGNDCSLDKGAVRKARHGPGGAPTRSARGEGRGRAGSNGAEPRKGPRGRGPRTEGQRRRENVGQVLRPAGADRHLRRPGGAGSTAARGGGRTGAGARRSAAGGGMPADRGPDLRACRGTPCTCTGALGTWQCQESPAMGGRGTLERPWPPTIPRRGVGESALQLRALGEGDRREAKVSTGRGQVHRPGSQGGLRTRGPGRNEAPTSRIESARAGNSPPTVVRAAELSRPSEVAR